MQNAYCNERNTPIVWVRAICRFESQYHVFTVTRGHACNPQLRTEDDEDQLERSILKCRFRYQVFNCVSVGSDQYMMVAKTTIIYGFDSTVPRV